MNDVQDMTEQVIAVKTDVPLREDSEVAAANALAEKANEEAFKARHPRISRMPHFSGFDTFVAKVRDYTPAIIVSNGSRLCLGLKAAADMCSIASAQRVGSKSPWRLRASLFSMGGEFLGVVFPEKKISQKRQEQYHKQNKLEYAITKTKEALNPKENVTETIGLTLMINGVFMAASGVKQSSSKSLSWEIVQGAMTAVAGSFMTYMTDRERAWQISHAIFTVRSPFAAKQAHVAYKYGYPDATPPVAKGDPYQWAKFALNQMACVVGVLYGGVKKMPDGSIEHIGKNGVEYTAPRQSRRMVSSKHLPMLPAPANDVTGTPATSISQMEQKGKVTEMDEVAHARMGAA